MAGLIEPVDDTPEDEADDTEDPMATPVTEPNDGEGEPAAGIEPEDAP